MTLVGALLLFLSLLPLSSSAAAATPSCPVDLSYVVGITWNKNTCLGYKPPQTTNDPRNDMTKIPCCQILMSLFGVALAKHLTDTSQFHFPTAAVAAACLRDFQAKLAALRIADDVVSFCLTPDQFVTKPNICARIRTSQDWVARLGPTTVLDSACRAELTNLTSCDGCVSAGAKVLAQLSAIDGNASHARDCRYFTILYAAGIVNQFGPESNGSLSCIFGLSMDSFPGSPGKTNSALVVGLTGAAVAVLVMSSLLGIMYFLYDRKKKKKGVGLEGQQGSRPRLMPNKGSAVADQCRYFSFAEIKAATNNFNHNLLIGVGGFGNVYKGHIDGGATAVAIKRLKPESSQGANEFRTEIETLSHLRHRNLVSLIGFCHDRREMILVYEHMPRGNLSGHLYDTQTTPLTWEQRLRICAGAASGLHYLHAGVKRVIIHRDVKTTNILLDEKWTAKVSDFGLSKVGPTNCSKTHVSTMVKGSIGYLDPEYYKLLRLTAKSDVYSFGVVLCEVLCGRPPVIPTAEERHISLAEWARSCYRHGTIDQMVDPNLTGQIAPECLEKYVEIAVRCVSDKGADRPSMKEVLGGLESAMRLQSGINAGDHESDDTMLVDQTMDGDGALRRHCSWGDKSGVVFSEINDVQAR